MGSIRLHACLKWFMMVTVLFALGMAFAPTQAQAQGGIAGTILAPKGVCDGFAKDIIEKIVKCLTSTDSAKLGAVPNVVKQFLASPLITGLMAGINGAIFMLGITLLGVKVAYLPDARVTKKELWLLLFKIGGLMWFSANIYNLYLDSVNLINGLMTVIAQAVLKTGLCNVPKTDVDAFWKLIDCLFQKVTGIGTNLGLAGGLVGGLVAFIFSGPAGFVIAITMVYFVVKLIFTVGRVIHLYVMSFIGLGFTFCISFLFVPLLFFQETKQYFDKWLRLTVGYILTPIFLFAYLGFAFLAIDEIVLCGSDSVLVSFGATSACSSGSQKTVGQAIFDKDGLIGNNMMTMTASSNPSEAAVGKMTPTGQTEARMAKESSAGKGSSVITINTYKLDLNKVGSPSAGAWVKKVLSALIAACLLIYILYELLEYIPEIATELSHGGFVQGAIHGERALGEAMALSTVKLAKDLPVAVAKGFVNGGKAGAVVAAAQALNSYRKEVGASNPKELRG